MKILLRSPEGWRTVDPVVYDDEDALQSLLKRSPEIIPTDPQGTATATVWCREYPTSAGPIDLLGIGSDGSVTIMECKLARNQQIRREVVGQVLDYASALWAVSQEELEATFARLEGAPPIDRLAEIVSSSNVDWEPGAARAALGKALADGSFRLLIAVDETDQGLKRIISYINSRGGSDQRLKLVALTFPRYSRDGVEILVPESFGDEASTAVSTSSRRASRDWTTDDFLKAITDAGTPTAGQVARDLIAWMERHGTEPAFGHGPTGPMYVLVSVAGGATARPFDLSTSDDGRLEVLFNVLGKIPPFDRADMRHQLKERLNAIPGVNIADRTAEEANWTSFAVAKIAEPAAHSQFFTTLDWFASRVADR